MNYTIDEQVNAVLQYNANGLKLIYNKSSKPSNKPVKTGGKKGSIHGRTAASARKLQALITNLDLAPYLSTKGASHGRGLYVTLTFPDEIVKPYIDARATRRKALTSLQGCIRYAFGKLAIIWLLEFKERQTGEYIGRLIPHFHLIMFFDEPVEVNTMNVWFTTKWSKILKVTYTEVSNIAHVIALYAKDNDIKPLIFYIAKRHAKWPRNTGRTWGVWYESKLPLSDTKISPLNQQQTEAIITKLKEWGQGTHYYDYAEYYPAVNAVGAPHELVADLKLPIITSKGNQLTAPSSTSLDITCITLKKSFPHSIDLFAGVGGGILAHQYLHGWQSLLYVEKEEYPRRILQRRIAEGWLHDALLWGDVCELTSGNDETRPPLASLKREAAMPFPWGLLTTMTIRGSPMTWYTKMQLLFIAWLKLSPTGQLLTRKQRKQITSIYKTNLVHLYQQKGFYHVNSKEKNRFNHYRRSRIC
ncbi:MAG TPA: hypothetical protein VLL52_06040 [Anaerolineae bacterium]|nr:hypothetical protein [Anaerolineae bacterium]